MKYITIEALEERRLEQLEYFKENNKGGSQPRNLFDVNGVFNYKNWNCGEATFIRHFVNKLEWNERVTREFDVIYKENDFCISGVILISKQYYEDTTYVQITVDGCTYRYTEDDNCTDFIDQYLIKIYKSRGAIEDFRRNGQPIKRGEYLSLLNILQGSGLIQYE